MRIPRKPVVLLFFVLVAYAGLYVVRDYGVSVDEPTQRRYGEINWNYLFKGDDRLLSYKDRYYGPAFEILLYGMEKIGHLKDSRTVYLTRHVLTFSLFLLALWFFYLLLYDRFNHWGWGLLGAALLVLSPRIWAHAHFNSKDIPFLSLFIIAMYTLQQYGKSAKARWMLGHALVCALLTDIRVLGLLVPGFTVLMHVWHVGQAGSRRAAAKEGARLGLFSLLLFGFVTLFWPTLWHNPVGGLWTALKEMSRYPWPGDLLYLGRVVKATALPWHYPIVWMARTIPVFYVTAFVAGAGWLGMRLCSRPREVWQDQVYDLFVLGWFGLPLAAVFLFHSVLYNGWRHLYFIYPALLYIALLGLRQSLEWIRRRVPERFTHGVFWIGWGLLGCYAAFLAGHMVRLHPFEYLYFNTLGGGLQKAQGQLELDYWGLTYYDGLKTIARRNREQTVSVYLTDPVVESNWLLLPASERKRIVLTRNLGEAQYYMTNGVYAVPPDRAVEEVYRLTLEHAVILKVLRLPNHFVAPEERKIQRREEIMVQNKILTQSAPIGSVAYQIENRLKKELSAYLRNAEDLQLSMEPFSSEKIRRGEFDQVRLQAKNGELGDFQHKALGIPFTFLDVTVRDLIVNLGPSGPIEIVQAGTIQVNRLELEDQAVNRALSRSKGDEKNLRLFFEQGKIKAKWLGKPPVEVDVRLWVAADAHRPQSDNIWFEMEKIRISHVPVPKKLVQWGIEDYNPLIPTRRLPSRIKLGNIHVEQGRLLLHSD